MRSMQDGELDKAAELHCHALSLMALGILSDPLLGSITLAMPIYSDVRSPALPVPPVFETNVEAVLEDAGLVVARREV